MCSCLNNAKLGVNNEITTPLPPKPGHELLKIVDPNSPYEKSKQLFFILQKYRHSPR